MLITYFIYIFENKKNMAERLPYICIYGVSPKIVKDLKKISKENSVTLSDFLKPKLREIVEDNKHILKFEDEE